VAKWRRRYERRTLFSDWLATRAKGSTGKLTREQKLGVAEFVDDELVTDARQVVAFIRAEYGVVFTVNGVTKLLHRLGFVCKQTTMIPGKLDEAAQASWLAEHNKLRDELPEDEVVLYADGVHPTHNTRATRAWVRRGHEKQVPTNPGRGRLNINGALDVNGMRVVTRISDTLNAESTIAFLADVEAAYPDKVRVHVVVDNARYYRNAAVAAWLAAAERRVQLVFLPPYSPNLNLIERLWRYLHKYVIGATRREKFAEFERDIAWFLGGGFAAHEQALRKFIGTEPHLITANA
jgi:transposase